MDSCGPCSGAGTVQGSRQVGPATTSKAALRSATRLASGPLTAVSWTPIGAYSGSMLLAWGTRPSVGLSAAMPQHWAGWRSDPRPSLPSPNGLIPVAIAAASPALDAPGVLVRSHGLTVAPHSSLSQCQRIAPVGRFVRPIAIAPAAFIRSTIGASRAGYACASAAYPWVVGVPTTSMLSLIVNGTPWNGGRSSPAATARSAAFAASNACSPRTMTTALIEEFTDSIRRRWASTTSTLDACPLAIASASSVALIRHNSVSAAPLTQPPPSTAPGAA